MAEELRDEDRHRLQAYAANVEATFGGLFRTASARFPDFDRLLSRFREAVANRESGRAVFGAVDEAHNELCVAAAILHGDVTSKLSYEPRLPGSRKTIDFKADLVDGRVFFVDVKTIRPDAKDRWAQYQKALAEKWFPDGVEIDLAEDACGGEMWHDRFAARSHMREYAIETEQKIAEISSVSANARFTLTVCSDGFRWTQDELEDFVAFYKTGRHRSDDPFAKMERDYMRKNSIRLSGTIHYFAWICRSQRDICATEVNWNVQPPEDPGEL